MFRIELINNKEELMFCFTYNNYGDMIEKYEYIKNKEYSKYKGLTMQVFTGLNIENLKENKDMEVNL